MNEYELIAIGLYMALMIGIGIYSWRKSNSNSDDFLIGGRKMGAAVTALSAGAADMSGWLLMGLPGAMYLSGLSSAWIAIGLTIGAYFNYVIVAPRLRVYTEVAQNAITLPVFFENRFKDKTQLLKIVSSIFILVFFTLYTSAGMVSGGRLFESAFGIDYYTGLYATTFVVVLYTFLGGFLAVSLTDFVQGTIMVTALVIIPIVLIFQLDGLGNTLDIIHNKGANYLDLLKGTTTVSIVSLLAWGLGYFGQPHILVRFMAIGDVKDIPKAKRIGISWMILTVGGALLLGLFGIAYLYKFDQATMLQFDQSKELSETIFIHLSRALFHPLIGGFLLSAILAAVMSTISSQLLVTSSSMTEDIYKAFFNKTASPKRMLLVSRLSVLIVAIIALLLSLNPKDSILNLVGNAWAGFGAAFGPLIILSLLWKKTTATAGLLGMLVGGATVLLWVYIPHDYKSVYEIIPGFILSFLTIVIVSFFSKPVAPVIVEEFDQVTKILK
ncbi:MULTISPECIES: sodium/proline symporter PutP [unclassified Sphingobacterium]|uniref:sodium/proline symporter PutP n=1 Tax=unclassified Sphingobacterium TaxID=2609468 RepID=UPI0010442836|nr:MULTISPECIES: sodium/proline symporter PutP [unclassified Sphingobacterium]MBB2953943.1 SSS family solute:Na+ symporter [Sphingobacterium sp. JUb56]MCS3553289.1 SSS family solute:Na+ symporter [Sphingobacterium sp. JUb21]TCR09501.1 SSS family solute:Na+ symporter [Sphingobacterium sp. JUb20]